MKVIFLAVENRLTRFSMAFSCAMLALAASLGMFQILCRFLFEIPAEWTEVMIRFSLIWMVFMGIPEAFRLGSMVSIDLMHRLVPPLFRRILDGMHAIVGLILLGVIIWYGWDYTQRGSVQSMIGLEGVSMFWAYLALPVGSCFAALGVIGNFLDPKRHELDTAQ
ncbi:MAG: TRAP transporter small permease [Betaproteobacteria bacterium]